MLDNYKIKRALVILKGIGNAIIIALMVWFILSWLQAGFISMGETSSWNLFGILMDYLAKVK